MENKTQLAVMTDCLEMMLKKLALPKHVSSVLQQSEVMLKTNKLYSCFIILHLLLQVLEKVFDPFQFSNRLSQMKDNLLKEVKETLIFVCRIVILLSF